MPILYLGECDLMIHPQKYSVIFSRMHYVTFVRYVHNMHHDTEIAVCKRSLRPFQRSQQRWDETTEELDDQNPV